MRTRCGWFSDRSVCYLAAAKPVIVQDTGFGRNIPTGRGLFAFDTIEEAAEAVEKVNRDYTLHCKAAWEIACEFFDAKKLLSAILKDTGL